MQLRIGLGLRKRAHAVLAIAIGAITHVATDEPLAALTFDDGPHPNITPRLLDVLLRGNARATFFMIGEAAQQHPRLVRRVVEEGHAIGNHSWNHPSFPLLTRRERIRQVRACEQALAPYGHRLFRPPYGHQSITSRLDLCWLGHDVITWNIDAGDWRNLDADQMSDRLVKCIHPGSITVFHDGGFDITEEECLHRGPTVEVVTRLLTQLRGRFRFVTIPELLRCGKPHREFWGSRANPPAPGNTDRRAAS